MTICENTNNNRRPMKGVRALELSEIWAGPFCGSLMGDMGAEVIKIESIQRIARGPIKTDSPSSDYPDSDPGEQPWNRQSNFNGTNRNKLGITLDLGTPKGVETFKELASVSDIIFCNYARRVMENFGLGYESIRKIKPDIIYMLMPGFGNTGPYKDYRSMGMAIDAITGHSHLRGYPELDHSSNSLVHHPDAVAGVHGVAALSTALFHKTRTGSGQFIDLSQAESFMTHLGEIFLEYQMTGIPRQRTGNRSRDFAPQGVYRCAGEDEWVSISVCEESQWNKFKKIIGLSEPVYSSFNTSTKRIENHDALDEFVNRWTRGKNKLDVMMELQKHGIPSGAVLNCGPDTYENQHLSERDFFELVEHPQAGIFPMSRGIFRFADIDLANQSPSPCLGEHNTQILENLLGISGGNIRDMELEKIIGTIPLTGSDAGGSRRQT
jgi:crotonobetainyl-CoA:carnitine CoA-transferase CaiB-like acyl-CoA transferase